jgi:hypothetical protein
MLRGALPLDVRGRTNNEHPEEFNRDTNAVLVDRVWQANVPSADIASWKFASKGGPQLAQSPRHNNRV